MNTRLRAPTFFIFVLSCLLIMSVNGGENPQEKSAALSGERVYTQKEVDVRAVVDGNSKVKSAPSVAGCKGEGGVLLQVVLHSSGKVTEVEVRRGSDCKKYQERAVKSVRKLKFKPAQKDGVAVSQYAMFEYNYRVW